MNLMPEKFDCGVVSPVYIPDQSLIDMTADEQTRRETGSNRSDQIGKILRSLRVAKCVCVVLVPRHFSKILS
jgi:hypothetical protein